MVDVLDSEALYNFGFIGADLKQKERHHNEIGAPDYRIKFLSDVLTPWDEDL